MKSAFDRVIEIFEANARSKANNDAFTFIKPEKGAGQGLKEMQAVWSHLYGALSEEKKEWACTHYQHTYLTINPSR